MRTKHVKPELLFGDYLNDYMVKLILLFSSSVRKYRKSYCTISAVGVGVGSVGVGVNTVKDLRQSF